MPASIRKFKTRGNSRANDPQLFRHVYISKPVTRLCVTNHRLTPVVRCTLPSMSTLIFFIFLTLMIKAFRDMTSYR